jgi:ribosome maturation factor RimP
MDLKTLQGPVEAQLSLLGFELVLLESEGAGTLRVYIEHRDHSVPVSLDDCAAVSGGLAPWLDVEFPDLRYQFGLEISSPGLERPLLKPEHFDRFKGRLCRVQTRLPLEGQKRFKGWIGAVADSGVTIEEDGRLVRIPLDMIQRARLAPFDEETTPGPRTVARAEPAGAEKADRNSSPWSSGTATEGRGRREPGASGGEWRVPAARGVRGGKPRGAAAPEGSPPGRTSGEGQAACLFGGRPKEETDGPR